MKNPFPPLGKWLMVAAFCCWGCGFAAAQSWTLSWSDEFSGAANSPIDNAKWRFETGILNVNNEVEYYCAPGSSTPPCLPGTPNAYLDGSGHLIIKALRVGSSVAPNSGSWTSARLNTANHLASFKYGRIESSMRLPVGPGLWPAFWALGTNITTVGWPASGEIDYMENVPASSGLGPGTIKSTLHGPGYSGSDGLGKDYAFAAGGRVNTAFHTYGAIWSPNMVQFYVDHPSNVFFVRTASDIPAGTAWPYNANFFLLFNLAVGGTGSWPGTPDSTTPNPALMLVDYVRAYRPSRVSAPAISATSISVTAGQVGTSTLRLNPAAGSGGRVYLSCTTTAPKAACSIASPDPLNSHTLDFSRGAAGTATVTVTTTAAASGRLGIRESGWTVASALGGLFAVFGLALIRLGPVRDLRQGMAGSGLLCVLLMFPSCSGTTGKGAGGEAGAGTTAGNYNLSVNAYTVSNSDGAPDATATIPFKVN